MQIDAEIQRVSSEVEIPPFRWRDIVNGHALLFLALMIAVYLVLVVALARVLLAPTGKGDQYMVLLPPWNELDRIYEVSTAVDARVIGLNGRTNAFLLYARRPDAVDALYRAGAWLVLDPGRLGGILGCGPTTQRRGPRAPGQADTISAGPGR